MPASSVASLVSASWHRLFQPQERPFEQGEPQHLHADDAAVRQSAIDRLIPVWLVQPAWRGVTLSIVLALLVGGVDALTDREFQLVPIYLVPVTLASWTVGRRAGLAVALICASVWLIGDLAGETINKFAIAPYLNATGLAIVFAVMAHLVARMKNWTAALERAVRNRTAALNNEMHLHQQAEEARVRAERLAIVGTMSAQLAHEVRNPLGAMTLNLQLLEGEIAKHADALGSDVEEQRQLLSEMQAEVRRIGHVVDGCINLIRHPETHLHLLPLNDFLQGKLRLTQAVLIDAKVNVGRDFDEDLRDVRTDGDKLWQALINLITNAKEAMPQGGLLHIATRRLAQDWQIVLTDTGCGMSTEELAELYTPFHSSKPEGTGLGLMLVQEIVRELGGRIDCDSQPGIGTIFTLTFPLPTSPTNLTHS